MVSVTDPYGRILGFLDRSRYFSIKFCTATGVYIPSMAIFRGVTIVESHQQNLLAGSTV
jgi:hypothetical protein